MHESIIEWAMHEEGIMEVWIDARRHYRREG